MERHGPREKKRYFQIKQDEQNGNQVVAHVKRHACIAKCFKSAFIRGIFFLVGSVGPQYIAQYLGNPTDRNAAMRYMQEHQARGEVVTGLLYVDPLATDLHTALNTSAAPLNSLDADRLCPGAAALARLNAALR